MYRVNKTHSYFQVVMWHEMKKIRLSPFKYCVTTIALDDIITLRSQRAGGRTRGSKSELYYKKTSGKMVFFWGLFH